MTDKPGNDACVTDTGAGPSRPRRQAVQRRVYGGALCLKVMLFLVLFMSRDAVAEWAFLIAADDADWYVDETLTRKRGSMAKVWTLQDYRSGQPFQSGEYFSSKIQAEIRCHSREWRVFYFSSYSGHGGEGAQLYVQEAAGAWRNVIPNTVSEALYEAGCIPGKK